MANFINNQVSAQDEQRPVKKEHKNIGFISTILSLSFNISLSLSIYNDDKDIIENMQNTKGKVEDFLFLIIKQIANS
jgi:hypothetical protein